MGALRHTGLRREQQRLHFSRSANTRLQLKLGGSRHNLRLRPIRISTSTPPQPALPPPAPPFRSGSHGTNSRQCSAFLRQTSQAARQFTQDRTPARLPHQQEASVRLPRRLLRRLQRRGLSCSAGATTIHSSGIPASPVQAVRRGCSGACWSSRRAAPTSPPYGRRSTMRCRTLLGQQAMSSPSVPAVQDRRVRSPFKRRPEFRTATSFLWASC